MVRSMTGYGKGENCLVGKKITAEIRTLNSKQLDLSVKLPALYRVMDQEIRQAASRSVRRGKADIYITYENNGESSSGRINARAFGEYYRQVAETAAAAGAPVADHAAIVAAILRMPDVISSEVEEVSEEEAKALMQAVEQAFENLDAFRVREGRTLIADLMERVDKIYKMLQEIEPHEKARTEAVKRRIREHIEAAEINVDENRLEQEIVFYVEKLDITEEKVRLANHCAYFREVVEQESDPGRKLGFISQEMGREINTLGSKANDATIQRIVVGMKDELEKIKEQLLNIL